ncbi:S8 family serine peptidase [Herbiconiux sp. P15]|uniref:S8 family serine peptidase n=1 Tax=Herbiconiux liukaitaii TaxID=3342799 RepID=UPI0035BB7E95
MKRLPALLAVPALVALALVTPSLPAQAAPASEAATTATDACTPSPAYDVVKALGIDSLQNAGLDGAGLTIGVISTSYDNYAPTPTNPTPATDAAADVASGALPGVGNPCGFNDPVLKVDDSVASDDEGRAMLQIVHAIAPAAKLAFATGASNDPDGTLAEEDQTVADAIDALVAADVDIIVDDIMIEGDLAFASGFAASAAERATEAGVLYTVAAGNLNHVGETDDIGPPFPSAGYSIASWQSTAFRDTGCPASVEEQLPGIALECLDFDPGAAEDNTDTITLYPPPKASDYPYSGVLQWGEAPYATTSQLYAFFLNADGTVDVENTISPDSESGLPIAAGGLFASLATEVLTTRSLVIARVASETTDPLPVSFQFFSDDGERTVVDVEYFESTETDTIGSTLVGRAANPSSITVAAAFSFTSLERFSSAGPQVRYFGDVTAVGTAPERLAEPEVKVGPTITALDGIPTTFFGVPYGDVYVYSGTSAATPVVAGVLALGRQAVPTATDAQLTDALTSSATPLTQTWLGTVPAETSGAGLIDAASFLTALRALPTPTPTPTPAPTPGPSPSPAAGPALAATGGSLDPALWAAILLALGAATLATTRRRPA